MKKIVSFVAIITIILATLCSPVFAEEQTAVFVTICDKDGKIALANEKISVTDADGDGALTINDALYCAHEAKFEGGAALGYKTELGAYGLSMSKLWGAENGTGFGYYLNNASAWSLTDTVKNGDTVNAFVYTDMVYLSDTFSFFDKGNVDAVKNASITLTLFAAGYDENFAPITTPVANATLTIDGVATQYKTDAQGKVTIKLSELGKHTVSAQSEDIRLVAPVCVVNVSENVPTGDDLVNYLGVMSVCIAIVFVCVKFKKTYER